MTSSRPVRRVALVGLGGIAESAHLPAFRSLGARAEVVAGVDVDAARAERFCRTHGVPAAYDDVATMVEREQPDLVSIASPPAVHVPQALAAMERGAWVICEKPLCGSLADLDRLRDVQQQTGAWCCSVLQWRFGDNAVRLKQLVDEGRLGRPLLGVSLTTWFRGADYYAVPWRGSWATELGGASLSQGVHALDLLTWLFGAWEEVRGLADTVDRDIEVDDAATAIVRFADGAMATVVSSVLSPREESYLRFDFARATVELRHLYHYTNADWVVTPAPGHADVAGLLPAEQVDERTLHARQFVRTLDAMDDGGTPPVTPEEVRPTVELLSAHYKASEQGFPVRRGAIVPGDRFYDALSGRTTAPVPAEEQP